MRLDRVAGAVVAMAAGVVSLVAGAWVLAGVGAGLVVLGLALAGVSLLLGWS